MDDSASVATGPLKIGRYVLYDPIASGGMATVHVGRLVDAVGFSRTVAIKRLRAGLSDEPQFVSMLLDEARVAGRIRHPNVVSITDVVTVHGELFLVMDYIPGETLSRLVTMLGARRERVPLSMMIAIMSGVLRGLHAAHETVDERGEPLGIVHRDVSPQNIIVGTDGLARVLDFGIAKARGRIQTTQDGEVKGKLRYMAPEQLQKNIATPRTDVYAAGVVTWELIAGRRLFDAESQGGVVSAVLSSAIVPPSDLCEDASPPSVVRALDAVVLRALARDPAERFASAGEMAGELEKCAPPATAHDVAAWLKSCAGEQLTARANMVARVESDSAGDVRARHAGPEELTAVPAVSSTPRPVLAGSASVAIDGTSRNEKRPRTALFIAIALVAALVAAGAFALRGPMRLRADDRSESPVVGAPPPASVPPSASAIVPAPSDSTTAVAPSVAPALSEPPARSSPAPTASAPRRSPTVHVPAGTRRPAADICNPPFVWDEQGVKRYKPECM